MIIRKARLKDIAETCKMGYDLNKYHEVFDKYFAQSKNAMQIFYKLHKKALRSSKSIFLVAEDKGKIVGFARAKIDKRPTVYAIQKIGFIDEVYIKKDYRRMDISKMFMTQIIPWFKNKKIEYVELHVHSENQPAIKAYGKYKFKTYFLTQRMKIQ